MKKIAVLTDFSESSRKALLVANQIALVSGAELIMVHVYYSYISTGNEYNYELEAMLLQTTREKLEAEASLKEIDTKVKTVLVNNIALSSVFDHEDLEGVELVVMGVHGSSGVEQFMIGSNTSKMLKKSPCPILTIPEDIDKFEPKTIVLASNFYLENKDLLEKASLWRQLYNSELHLLKIVTPSNFETTKQTDKQFENFLEGHDCENCKIVVRNHIEVIDGILEYAEDSEAELIICGTHGRTGIGALINDSMAQRLSESTAIPILSLKLPKMTY